MMKPKFTTGFQGIDGPNTSRIVDVNGESYARFATEHATPERLAMAAGPELLSGLTQAVEVLDFGQGTITDAEKALWIKTLRAIISKANGRE